MRIDEDRGDSLPGYLHATHRRARDTSRSWQRPLIIASVVIASVLSLSVGGVAVFTVMTVVSALHPFTANAADAKIKPFEAALDSEGGTRLCTNGDAGYGPDNL